MPIPSRLLEPVQAALRGQAVPWPALTPGEVTALVEHGVAPLVYSVAQVRELREQAIRAAALEPFRAADFAEVLEALFRQGVEALILKGGALAYDIYGSPDLRPRGDCDLLIAETSLDATREALLALGFSESATSGEGHALRQTIFTRAGAIGMHVYDVHWAVANTPLFASVLRFEELRARATALPRLGPHALGLSHADALLLACIHRVAHHHDSDRLIWLVDIGLLRDRMTPDEHQAFWRAAADGRVVAVCTRSIVLAGQWMSQPTHDLAADWLRPEEIGRDEASRVFLDRELTRGGVLLADLRALPWRARAERLWQLAFPPRSFMERAFGAHSRIVLPWFYVYRGMRGLLRLFRRAAV